MLRDNVRPHPAPTRLCRRGHRGPAKARVLDDEAPFGHCQSCGYTRWMQPPDFWATAVMDVVSWRWLTTLVSAGETSTQVEVAFLAALREERLQERIDARLIAKLRAGEVTAADLDGPEADGVPVLIVMSDDGSGSPTVASNARTIVLARPPWSGNSSARCRKEADTPHLGG